MVCKECGKENKDDAAYCDGCGATLKKKRAEKRQVFCRNRNPGSSCYCRGCSEKCLYWRYGLAGFRRSRK